MKINLEFDSYSEMLAFARSISRDVSGVDEKLIKKVNSFHVAERDGKKFTQFEDDYIVEHYHSLKSREIAKALSRNMVSIRNHIYQLRQTGVITGSKTNRSKPVVMRSSNNN